MGKHTVKRKILNISFEKDSEHHGLEIRAGSVSFGRILAIADQAEALRAGNAIDAARGGLASAREFVDEFTGALISWNAVDEDGQDIPPTREGLLSQDIEWVLDILLTWFDSMVSVPSPLGESSTSGKPFPEESMPMEPLSPNPLN